MYQAVDGRGGDARAIRTTATGRGYGHCAVVCRSRWYSPVHQEIHRVTHAELLRLTECVGRRLRR
jgi:hypothetical protein